MSNPIAGLFTWKLHGDGKTLKPARSSNLTRG